MIIKCECKHEYQDQVYGKGNRIHNKVLKSQDMARCVVCQKINNGSSKEVTAKVKK